MNEFNLNIGAQVFCSDGKCGSLAKVALHPETRQVTHLIVEEGFLMKRARVFPFSLVDSAIPAEIHLLLHSDDLDNYPVYREETIETPAANPGNAGASTVWREGGPYGVGAPAPLPVMSETIRHGVADDLVLLDRSTSVEGLDGRVGKLDHFLVDAASGEITQIIVEQGLLFTSKRAIPAYMASTFTEDGIFVEAAGEALEGLPEQVDMQGAATPRPERRYSGGSRDE